MSQQLSWYDALDLQLARRLIRPMVQPGVIDARMARVIIARSQYLNNRLPLLTQLQRRGVTAGSLQPGQIPIVYARKPDGNQTQIDGLRGSSANPVNHSSASPSPSSAIEQTPIIYAQSLLPDTSPTHDTLGKLQGNAQTEKPPVVQAKFASPSNARTEKISPLNSSLSGVHHLNETAAQS